ncbi:GNAT family N-acetyltransferase [Paramagnetospirillum caucaseum]|uniref:hypothetical protein n=1 Tax=Paramagnetospirillum caucaseum TaxID=1244869 RepID=UPI001268DE73|nr:hypothetical protein [Paramagnetospirillum caucaseum]
MQSETRKNNQIQVKIAGGIEEMVQAIAIRSAVYVGERGWSFKEEWDGNDFTATHLIATVNGDPAGTMDRVPRRGVTAVSPSDPRPGWPC